MGEQVCGQEGCEKPMHTRNLCQNHYKQMRRRERGLKKPGPKPGPVTGVPHDWSSSKPRSTDTHCAREHPWNEHTEGITTGEKRFCRYCAYLASAVADGRTTRDLESWMKWREDRGKFCKRGHPRQGRVCFKCQVDNRRRRIYGIEPDEYDAIIEKQGNECAGCLVDLDTLTAFDIHIDHDHKTGAVRGILCSNCNLALGKLKEDPAILRRLADYIVISTN